MPPFRDESMCTQPKQPREAISPPPPLHANDPTATRTTMDMGGGRGRRDDGGAQNDDDGSSPPNDGGATDYDNSSVDDDAIRPRRPSPVRRRHHHRDQASSTTRTSRDGRHVTNINRINVINNYGTAGGGGGAGGGRFKRKKRRTGGNNSEIGGTAGWFVVRVALVSLLLFWLGTMAWVIRSAHSQSEEEGSKAAMNLTQWKKLSDAIAQSGAVATKGLRGGKEATATAGQQQRHRPAEVNQGGEDNATEDPPDDAAENPLHETRTALASPVFAASTFRDLSSSEFQRRTPHAPSCSRPISGDDVSFTLVSQLSEDRVWMVQYHCQRWGNQPMSIAVFTERTAEDVMAEAENGGCSAEHLTVQTLSPSEHDPTGTEYPVNMLRNLALAAVRTTHVVYADVDFWPSTDLHSTLMEPAARERFAADPKLGAVVPVFQMVRRCREYKDCRSLNIPVMPKRKADLFALIKKKRASTFDPTNVGGHGSTRYITWRDQDPGTFVDLPCIKSNRYEPYLAFRYCSDLPPFQEKFTGYGKNKMTWVMQLRRAGYLFSQIGGVFLVHYPHLESQARLEWDKKPDSMLGKKVNPLIVGKDKDIDWASFKRTRVDALFLDFREWMEGTLENESRVPMCADALNDDVKLWVVDDDGPEPEPVEQDDDGEYFKEYSDYVDFTEVYGKCLQENSIQAHPPQCFKAASDFIESSILWALVGGESGYLGPSSQLEYLVEAEGCAKDFVELAESDEVEGKNGKFSFTNLMVDLYTNMGIVHMQLHSKSKATEFIGKALALNPGHESAQKILVQLSAMDEDDEHPQENVNSIDEGGAEEMPEEDESTASEGAEEEEIAEESKDGEEVDDESAEEKENAEVSTAGGGLEEEEIAEESKDGEEVDDESAEEKENAEVSTAGGGLEEEEIAEESHDSEEVDDKAAEEKENAEVSTASEDLEEEEIAEESKDSEEVDDESAEEKENA